MRIARTSLVTAVVLLQGCQHNPVDPEPARDPVQFVLEDTSIDSLTLSVQALSGEIMVMVGDSLQFIPSRHKDHPGNDLAAEYIGQKLRQFGLQVQDFRFSATGRSVYAVQTGERFPNQSYIICAHFDCYPPGDRAPGADDNASGTAAVLEAARLLSKYETDFSIIYAFWDEEEQGLHGSRAFAEQAQDSANAILGVINLDMIGWDSNDDGTILVDVHEMQDSAELANSVMAVNERYKIGLSPQTMKSFGRSDHAAFWSNGFGAIMLIEHSGHDWNNNYHTPDDRLEFLNLNFYHKAARLAIGTLASLVTLDPATPLAAL